VARITDADIEPPHRPELQICPGKIVWLSSPDREVRECTRWTGHGGDHRDAVGYPWNDERWLE
jgi:hypothetical protein